MSGEILREFRMRGGRRRPARRRMRTGALLGWTAAAVVPIALAFLWLTRDHTPMAGLVPTERALQVIVPDPLRCRSELLRAPWWDFLPEGSGVRAVRAQLEDRFGAPEWIFNNVLQGPLHLSAGGLGDTHTVLAATRISRLAALLEPFSRFAAAIHDDRAGGLDLRVVADGALYYAVRGRTLLASPSRELLIRALTLSPDEAIGEDALAQDLASLRAEELFLVRAAPGVVADWPAAERSFEAAFGLMPDGMRLRCALPVPNVLLAELPETATKPQSLPKPPDGIAILALNAGMPLPKLAQALQTAFPGLPLALPAPAAGPAEPPQPAAVLRAAIDGIAQAAGPALWLSWRGIDATAMVPAPDLIAGLDVDAGALGPLLDALPALPPALEGADLAPRRDAAAGIVTVDLIGGPAISPGAALRGGTLLLGTNAETLAETAASPPPRGALAQPGHLYLHLRPQPATAAIVEAGRELARFGAVRGFTPQSFDEAAKGWIETAARIHEIAALATIEPPLLRIELQARLAPQADAAQP